jgi:beta-1,4-mannosyltransferase
MSRKKTAVILVLGDLNRSPRMLNHCKAISEIMPEIQEISLIGFHGGDLRSDILNDSKVKIYYIPEKINNYLKKLPRFLFLLSAFIRIFFQIFFLMYLLCWKIPKFEFLILQNPPGIPAMYISSVACFFRRAKFVIDWHNYGYSILKVNKRNKIICYIAYLWEKYYGRSAHVNFTVSDHMKKHLKSDLGIDAVTLPDRAIKGVFKKVDVETSHKVLEKYQETKGIFTEISVHNEIKWKKRRPMMMLSSTSWTPDENFDILLDCFKLIEQNTPNSMTEDRVIFLITGRGPMKDEFMRKVQRSDFKLFDVRSVWLESDDYPKLLASADLGVCLHYSSSGYDLPMKVVDMFSAGLPACAVEYPAISDLVKHKENGIVFKDHNDLAEYLTLIINEFFENGFCEGLERFRENLKSFNECDWVSQWREEAYPVLINSCKLNLKKKHN